ncbi:F-box/FBD/LRR-repeat protein At1g13570-like isoform X1 [Lolium rigidum]|uniref:F-box/FBD/LRR-repeat protein At1g13570-like isoform X1 n=1 Tax=Lolium rigidum TaxID=89674 RepID=UPI001F5DE88C|nr:F-box/FBD/LRR-repeat protein At1g13570-like isoform X1 [Lolium rigidum]
MGNYLMSESATLDHCHTKVVQQNRRPKVKLEDLPEDLLGIILSKLSPNDVIKTSVLSSKWRYMWATCRRLSFNGVAACEPNRSYPQRYVQNFIRNVNVVLQKYHGMFVEDLEVKFAFDTTLVDHLNDWVSFAVSSQAKNLAFDLAPVRSGGRADRYTFPFQLLDCQSISRLQCIQLSFVSLKLPFQFRGFPSLRKLDLNLLHVTKKDLENMLSNCDSLEWLSIVKCHLNDELRVEHPLNHLLYLRVVNCAITKVEFNAARLSTFVYKGEFVPVIFTQSLQMENANILFFRAVFQHAFAALINEIPSIQNLTLHVLFQQLETRWDFCNLQKISQLRNIQFLTHIFKEDVDKILYLVSSLRAAPFIEKLDVHFGGCKDLWFANKGPDRQHLPHPHFEYSYLKDMHITGYKGARGQLQFLLHIVEHAPALQSLTVSTTQLLPEEYFVDTVDRSFFGRAAWHARYHLSQKLSPTVKLCVT